MTSTGNWPTVLVLGETGAGKTSLVQAVLGADIVPGESIGHGAPRTTEFACYVRNEIRLLDSVGHEHGDYSRFATAARRQIVAAANEPDVSRHVHVVWYVILGPGARVTEAELRFATKVAPSVLFVISKTDITRADQMDGLRETLESAGIPREDILAVSTKDTDAVEALLARTRALFEQSRERILADVEKHRLRKIERERRRRAAEEMASQTGAGCAIAVVVGGAVAFGCCMSLGASIM